MLCSIVFSIVRTEKPSSTLLACASICLAHSMETKQLRDKNIKNESLSGRLVTSTFEIFCVSISFALIEKSFEEYGRTARAGVERSFAK